MAGDALAANEDGSDIFMGQSLEDIESDIESTEEDIPKDQDEVVDETASDNQQEDVNDQVKEDQSKSDDDLQDEQPKIKSSFKEKLKFLSHIKLSKMLLIVISIILLSISGVVYYIYFITEDKVTKETKQLKEEKVEFKKEIEPVNLSLINVKRLNIKLKVLLDAEKEAFQKQKRQESKLENKVDIKKVAIQIAFLHKKMDDEFDYKINNLGIHTISCYRKDGQILFGIVNEANALKILDKIHINIAKDAFISKKDVDNLCK